ncbi:MAG TPA: DUF5317 domain-containing protein [Bacillota bacterium]|jgi:hypothetical protein
MTIGLLLALAVGWVRGGRIGRFTDFRFRYFGVILLGFAIQLLLRLSGPPGFEPVVKLALPLHVLTYVLILSALAANLSTPGMKAITVGVALNFLVIAANGVRMPVSREALERIGQEAQIPRLIAGKILTHTLTGPGTHLRFLADVLFLPNPFPRPTIFSLGDVLMLVGVFILVQTVMLGRSASPRQSTG